LAILDLRLDSPAPPHEREAHHAGGKAPAWLRERGGASPSRYLQRAGTPEVGRDAVLCRALADNPGGNNSP